MLESIYVCTTYNIKRTFKEYYSSYDSEGCTVTSFVELSYWQQYHSFFFIYLHVYLESCKQKRKYDCDK